MDFKDKVIINKKKMKSISIRIRDGKVLVSAPLNVSEKYILELLESKRGWIEEKLTIKRDLKIADLLKRDTLGVDEKVRYLGKEYVIKIKEKSSGGIQLIGDNLIINCYKKENALELLKKFYIDNINKIFKEKFEKIEKLTGLYAHKLTIKFMNTRWGSCNKVKGYVNLNGELIAKKESSIDYVILHELCHLVHGNHSKDFYSLVEKYMENYREEEIYLNGK
ncbi:SprT family zinc-dependent metalloprotease [uncultured Clostridium sp.]|uniref:M48 family metallopeptidase n=1 Tax=uncultured Clostridium sp. TaxID=59620 RepID=UPI00262472F7|nr:SprT family zinc-dependent metalloprotease [uncultured Clostridium sp.]